MATRQLPANASLENLKKQAKSLLKAVKAKDSATLSRIKPFFSNPDAMGLQDAQLVLARDYGFSSWATMKAHISSGAPPDQPSADQLANDFLHHVVNSYSEVDDPDPARWQYAKDLLDDHPEIRDENIYTACAIGDTARVKKWLDEEPGLINQKGGYYNWEPLMYAAYSRLPGVSTLEVGKLLIGRGADPNAHYMWGGQYKFTALTGVFGQGESGPTRQAEHPEFEAFARLLLDAGASPNDSQAAYNRMFLPDNTCLELLLEYGLSRTDKNNWFLCENDELLPHPDETMHYQLIWALKHGMTERTKLLVDHGVDVNKSQDGKTPYEWARLGGDREVADYLVANGATATQLSDVDAFRGACLSADRGLAEAMLRQKPELIADVLEVHPDLIHDAAGSNNLAAVALMTALGLDVNHLTSTTPLHQAAWGGHVDMVKLLLEKGADPTLRDLDHFSPPIGWAIYNGRHDTVAFLDDCDMDVFTAAARGKIDRLEKLLDAAPHLLEVKFRSIRPAKDEPCEADWMTPLAIAVGNDQVASVEYLLQRGANPNVTTAEGTSLLDIAKEKAGETVLRLLAETAPNGQ
ncbi:MAG: ankyrin repeat domain-containing protein [Gammaproteobacteria bacterium]